MSRKINKDAFIQATRKWFESHAGYSNLKNAKAVIGISGGKDSSVVAALLKEAIGADHILGVMMPNGEQKDIQDSIDLINLLGIPHTEVNIEDAYRGILDHLSSGFFFQGILHQKEIQNNKTVTTNLPARLRMATLYAIANYINGRVVGTGNKAEIICCYYTLWGDGSCDFDPIADLYVDEVIELGRQLELPDRFILKTPNDGMSGMSDEEKLGFKYADVKTYYESKYCIAREKLGTEICDKIAAKIAATECKRNLTHIPYISIDGELKNLK